MPPDFQPLAAGTASANKPPASGTSSAHRQLKSLFKPIGLSGDSSPAAVMAAAHKAHAPLGPTEGGDRAEAPLDPVPRRSSVITRLIRDGDRITHIEVQCGCGEVITLECDYAVSGAAGAGPDSVG
jgi:hypothetical protein